MLSAEGKQFRLTEDGQILYQPDISNPVPGQPVACVRKGAALLRPDVDIAESLGLEGQDRAIVTAKLAEWLCGHIKTVLEPLNALEPQEGEGVDDNVRGISTHLHDNLGIAQRADLESLIAALTPEGRKALRSRKVRLGPVLVFIPDLNKPAAVRLRALLWTLWNDKGLPASIPPDGMTSLRLDLDQNLDQGGVDTAYYCAIGYPVYGPRAIRVDMFDRLVGAIYDEAKGGTFQARHQMAEWLGCTVADLYAVLEAMGHVKIADPDDVVPAPTEVAPEPEDTVPAEPETPAVPTPRPELATFRLRRGRAYGGTVAKAAQTKRPEKDVKKRTARKDNTDKKPRRKDDHRKDNVDKVMFAAPAPTQGDSPFAVLQQLKMHDKK